jgi:hypothetical protein
LVDSRCEFDADLEVGQALRVDRDDLADARVPSNVRLVLPNLERPEPTKFDLLAVVNGLHQAVEDGVSSGGSTLPGDKGAKGEAA